MSEHTREGAAEQELRLIRETLLRLGVTPMDLDSADRSTYAMLTDAARELYYLRWRVQEAAQDVLDAHRQYSRVREVLVEEGGLADDDRSTIDLARTVAQRLQGRRGAG